MFQSHLFLHPLGFLCRTFTERVPSLTQKLLFSFIKYHYNIIIIDLRQEPFRVPIRTSVTSSVCTGTKTEKDYFLLFKANGSEASLIVFTPMSYPSSSSFLTLTKTLIST